MAKIERSGFFDFPSTAERRGRRVADSSTTPPTKFHDVLARKTEQSLDEESAESRRQRRDTMQQLIEQVDRISSRLQQTLTWSAITEYKKVITEILAVATQDMFHTQRIVSRHHTDSKQFVLIQEIDDKVNRLVSQFLQRQRSQLQVLELVGEINGLIVDLQS